MVRICKRPSYLLSNGLDESAPLSPLYLGAPTKATCMDVAIKQTLMMTSHFALLAGISTQEVQQWYLSVYIDAFEYVETPNIIGMSQGADREVTASNPYVSSGA